MNLERWVQDSVKRAHAQLPAVVPVWDLNVPVQPLVHLRQ